MVLATIDTVNLLAVKFERWCVNMHTLCLIWGTLLVNGFGRFTRGQRKVYYWKCVMVWSRGEMSTCFDLNLSERFLVNISYNHKGVKEEWIEGLGTTVGTQWFNCPFSTKRLNFCNLYCRCDTLGFYRFVVCSHILLKFKEVSKRLYSH